MEYRIVKKVSNGIFYPQYRRFLFWKGLRYLRSERLKYHCCSIKNKIECDNIDAAHGYIRTDRNFRR